jgi:hypothetical protein
MNRQLDQLSPFVEGFENPTMQTLFRELLKVDTPSKLITRKSKRAISVAASDGTCIKVPPNSDAPSNANTSTSEKVAFLKSVLQQQKESVDSLMESAKKIEPVSRKIASMDKAYDASFETELTSPMPNMSGTLQGFTIFFFTLSYFSFAIVVSIMVNHSTQNVYTALKVFGGFLIAFFLLVGLIPRIF